MPEWRPAWKVFGTEPETADVAQPSASPEQEHLPLSILWISLLAVLACSAFGTTKQTLIFEFLLSTFGVGAAIGLHSLGLVLIAGLGAILTYIAWKHPARQRAAGGAGLLFILSICALIYEGANAASFLAAASERYNIAKTRERKPDAKIALAGDRTISITGPIGPNLMRDFISAQRKHGPLTTVEITSPGGLIDEAMELAEYIEEHKITVVVRQRCLSACTMIAVASPNSYAEDAALFGFHRASPIARLGSELGAWGVKVTDEAFFDFLRRHRVPQSILDQAAKHRADSMYFIRASDLARYGTIRTLGAGI